MRLGSDGDERNDLRTIVDRYANDIEQAIIDLDGGADDDLDGFDGLNICFNRE